MATEVAFYFLIHVSSVLEELAQGFASAEGGENEYR
ncbi:hypothetical protein LILAB_14050 [Corallococcus macrosporus]|uniref:Uncharacterized protein n=1 Tax=Myxococcus fulvus (strain ATCC BAA-855 / HW-1) TaxID=483219 RepID=F8CCZ9_MYXFH|nr:hypothetical protein LILAB_14050 [Corallococcus macrosporus]